MKKSVVSAAMLLALGLSGAAGAVQMHGVVMGTLTSFSDTGTDKAWGYLSPGTALPNNVRIDFWFDSTAITSYDLSKDQHTYNNNLVPSQYVEMSATFNGTTRLISSAVNWVLHDNGYEQSKNLDVYVTESDVSENRRLARLDALSFADKSHPVLREAMLGHVVNTVAVKDSGVPSYFTYQGTVNGKAYNSRLGFNANSFALAPVPEPETWAMMLLGLGVVGYAARRRAS